MTSKEHHEKGTVQVVGRLLLGDSHPMRRLRSLIARLATSHAPVLIEGPTGSGKELVAETLHLCSGRPGAFVPFNVCAIADGTFESALFGHVRGAFTGALQDSPGYLSEADRGTAFFDEIGSLSMTAQAKLLRAIDTRSFRPVGARRDQTSDFRLVAASNDDLAALVGEGRFRADLFHRLRALVIHVPRLVDHLEDVPVLARHFARRAATEGTSQLSEEAIGRLLNHAWPGNVRELRNVVEFAMALADGPIVRAAEVSEALGARASFAARDDRTWMRNHLVAVLADCGGDTARAAERLGLHRSNVYRLMRRLGIGTKQRRHVPLEQGADGPSAPTTGEFALFAIDGANSHLVRANIDGHRAAASD
jgi:DNA-binding NtrC family response regulator